jgi:hypothetical protein
MNRLKLQLQHVINKIHAQNNAHSKRTVSSMHVKCMFFLFKKTLFF